MIKWKLPNYPNYPKYLLFVLDVSFNIGGRPGIRVRDGVLMENTNIRTWKVVSGLKSIIVN